MIKQCVAYTIGAHMVPTASVADIIRFKEAAGRKRDRQQLPTLRKLLERMRKLDG